MLINILKVNNYYELYNGNIRKNRYLNIEFNDYVEQLYKKYTIVLFFLDILAKICIIVCN